VEENRAARIHEMMAWREGTHPWRSSWPDSFGRGHHDTGYAFTLAKGRNSPERRANRRRYWRRVRAEQRKG